MKKLNIAPRIAVRDATEADVPTLTAIKGTGTDAMHHDRIRDAQSPDFRYLVLIVDQEVIGFACLVMKRPRHWSDANDTGNLPQIVDLLIRESHRGQGYGSDFIRAIEHIASDAGHTNLYISVEPLDNSRAYALYQRLGYKELQSEPYKKSWEFQDSDGHLHRGENRVVDMAKKLNQGST